MMLTTFVPFVFFLVVSASAKHPTLRWKKDNLNSQGVSEESASYIRWKEDNMNLQGAGGGGASSSSDSDSGDKDGCFAGTETLLLESGQAISIDQIQVGDRVQVSSTDGTLSFADVVFIPHDKNLQPATFITIETEAGASVKTTPSHYIMSGACGANDIKLTRAVDVSVGDCVLTTLGENVVASTSKTFEKGLYTVVTAHPDGIVVVNGFIASSFSYNHMITNLYYHIHRALYENIGHDYVLANMKTLGLALENIVTAITF